MASFSSSTNTKIPLSQPSGSNSADYLVLSNKAARFTDRSASISSSSKPSASPKIDVAHRITPDYFRLFFTRITPEEQKLCTKETMECGVSLLFDDNRRLRIIQIPTTALYPHVWDITEKIDGKPHLAIKVNHDEETDALFIQLCERQDWPQKSVQGTYAYDDVVMFDHFTGGSIGALEILFASSLLPKGTLAANNAK